MTAKLVTDADMYNYLGITASVDDPNGVALAIRDSVEELLESTTGAVFGPASTAVVETHDGTGDRTLWLKRPIAALTSITFKYDALLQDDYEVDVVNDITCRVGSRRLVARSFNFPCGRDNVEVTYNAQANQPKIALQAVRDVTAVVFRRIGSEDARSEQIGTFQHVLLRKLEESLVWSKAVELLQVPNFG